MTALLIPGVERIQIIPPECYQRTSIYPEVMPNYVWQDFSHSSEHVNILLKQYYNARISREGILLIGHDWVQRFAPDGWYGGLRICSVDYPVCALIPVYDDNGFPLLIQFESPDATISTVRYN